MQNRDAMETKEYLTLKEVVEVTGKSIATIRRKKAILEELGATCSTKGWQVTIEQLKQAGLVKETTKTKKNTSVTDRNYERKLKAEIENLTKVYEAQIKDLKTMVDVQKDRAEKAEKRLEKMMDILANNCVIKKKQSWGFKR